MDNSVRRQLLLFGYLGLAASFPGRTMLAIDNPEVNWVHLLEKDL